ncbi:Rne/Rng family ribonuclease [Mycobacterium sp.]|uniref:Rne/Rng family ribonuclease n=1 Tax=Mycobacterium sp. TaxID=1785 RepID=UPI0012782183|nr:Rne/Rng family ribonuclease [Mycobacterium sp.]KAA8967301.1 MAG: Rne/Rng family ribonuclease [Mycobacterium sp.]
MIDGGKSSDRPDNQSQHEDLPDRLRVHSLARALGTTSRRVLDALAELDGRIRSAHSSVDRSDAARVRDLLADAPGDDAPVLAEVPAAADAAEPESRLMLETSVDRPQYMPLFVAPKPVDTDDDIDDGDIDDGIDDGIDDDIDDEAELGEQFDRPAGRRRRRGRRGRGRGRGDQSGSSQPGDGGDEADQLDPVDAEDVASGDSDDSDTGDGGSPETVSRRRRRRRRRKAGSGDDADDVPSPDDPPNTVVHERTPRTVEKSDTAEGDPGNAEIQGIDGSTRLEAKRQRRRDGRDAGRRRPPVLTEAEFLARRESVERVMVVRDKIRTEPPHQGDRYTQIAVLEDGIVVEHFVTSATSASLVGNIYLGIVQNVLPSMEAAFVDIGRGRNGVLYAGEVNWEAAGLGGANRKIEQALQPGDYVVVQVSKDPVGHKGARLTTQVSLAGRYLVYVPGASSTGISRKLPDTERQRLKEILREVVPPDAGVIVRTASEGVKEEDIRADVNRLQNRWAQIEAQAAEIKEKAAGAAVALYEEPDVLVKVIRDLFNEDFSQLIVSGDQAWETITAYVNSVAPELVSKLTKYEADANGGPDVFAVHRIDEQLAKAMDRKVWLPSGGTLVIDRTEAMTVIDVNTGKFTGSGGNLEQTVTKNNLEAAEEIVRQLRLRDIGGIVVIDFIDMVLESNRDLVLRRLTEALARDRTRHQVSEVTSLGLVQLTRKRLGTGLLEAFSTTCPHCSGRGVMLHADPVDSASSNGRKSESRRNRRSKKSRDDESLVMKLPAHAPGEHPMFKAMAAANGRPGDDESTADPQAAVATQDFGATGERFEVHVGSDATAEDLDDDFEDADEVDNDVDNDDDLDDEEDLGDEADLDDGDLDLDDDLDVEPDEPDEPDDADESHAPKDSPAPEGVPAASVIPERPRPRRTAARPAGPPIRAD